MKKIAILCLVAFAALLLAPSFAPLKAADGAALFKAKCVACHGPDGSGNTAIGKKNNIRSLASPEVQKLTDAELTNIIANGGAAKKASHAYKSKGLTDPDIKALVTYIRSLKK